MTGDLFSTLLAVAAQAAAPPAPVSAPPPFPTAMPGEVLAAFATADNALAKLSSCIGSNSAVTPQRLETLDLRMQAMQRQANGVWGPAALQSLTPPASVAPDCSGAAGNALGTDAEAQLTRLAARLNAVLTPLRSGVWFGTMPLCGRGKVQAQVRIDNWSANPFLVVMLPPDLATELAALTRHQPGQRLAFRVGGRVVVEAQVNEPVTGGGLQISGADEPTLERAAKQLNGCAR